MDAAARRSNAADGQAHESAGQAPRQLLGQVQDPQLYVAGTYDLSEVHSHAVTAGGEHHALNRLKRFRKWFVEGETQEDVLKAPKAIRDSIQFELKEMEKGQETEGLVKAEEARGRFQACRGLGEW